MSRAIARDATFMGIRMIKARDILREFHAGKVNPVEIGRSSRGSSRVMLDGFTVAAILAVAGSGISRARPTSSRWRGLPS